MWCCFSYLFFFSLKLLLETIFFFFPPADSSASPPNFRPVESLMEYLLFFSLKCKLWEFAFKAMGRKYECVCTCFQWWFAACRVESQGQSTIPRRTLETDESYFCLVSRLMAGLRRTPLSGKDAELRRECHNWKPGAAGCRDGRNQRSVTGRTIAGGEEGTFGIHSVSLKGKGHISKIRLSNWIGWLHPCANPSFG